MSQKPEVKEAEKVEKTGIFIFNKTIRKRTIARKLATDKEGRYSIMTAKQGEYIVVNYGIFETDDKVDLKFLREYKLFNTDSPDGYREANEEEAGLIRKMRKNGVAPKSLIRNLTELREKMRLIA